MKNEAIDEERAKRGPSFFFTKDWWWFCLGTVALKLLLLAIDPGPGFYRGDSLAYLSAAIGGRMADGLSYSYTHIVHWLCDWSGSLTLLTVVQVFIGMIGALIVAWICRVIFLLPKWLSYLFGFFGSIDPLQLAWERYIMPETFSLFFYGLIIQQSSVYLRRPHLTTLLIIQLLTAIAISFDLMFLLPLQIMAVALPLIAFVFERCLRPAGVIDRAGPLQFVRRRAFWLHLAVSVLAILVMRESYRRATGWLAERQPGYSYSLGYSLLSAWGPAIRPQDSPDPRLAEIIRQGADFNLGNEGTRNAQRFARGHLIDRWRQIEADTRKSSDIAFRTAINALGRDPWAVMKIGAQTYYAFWTGRAMERLAKLELGRAKINERQQQSLLARYHWRAPAGPDAEHRTISTWYYTAAVPYYFAILLSPLLSLALVFVAAEKRYALLLFAHTWLIFCATFLMTLAPIIRYLEPLSVLMLLSAALALKSLYPALSDGSTEFQRGCAKAG